jgi:hypothetical protein
MNDVAPSRSPTPLRPSPTPSDEFTSILNLLEFTQVDDAGSEIGHSANGMRTSGSWLSVPGAGLDVRATSAGGTTTVRLRTIQDNNVHAYSGPDAMGSLLPDPNLRRHLVVVECANIAFHNLAQLDLLAQIVERANLLSTPCVIAGLDSRCRHLLTRWWPQSGLRLVGHICGNPALFGPAEGIV